MNASTAASTALPLRHSYWVVPGLLLAGEHPGGPTRDKTKDRLKKLLVAGIECFVDLTKPTELPRYDTLLPFYVEYARKAIKDHGLPVSRDQMVDILEYVGNSMRAGRPVYVHCRAGIGRTGTVIGCLLVERGFIGDGALDELNRLWQQSKRSRTWAFIPETEAQATYVREWQPCLPAGGFDLNPTAAAASGVGPMSAAGEVRPGGPTVADVHARAASQATGSGQARAAQNIAAGKTRKGSHAPATPYAGAGLAAAATQARAAVEAGRAPSPPPRASKSEKAGASAQTRAPQEPASQTRPQAPAPQPPARSSSESRAPATRTAASNSPSPATQSPGAPASDARGPLSRRGEPSLSLGPTGEVAALEATVELRVNELMSGREAIEQKATPPEPVSRHPAAELARRELESLQQITEQARRDLDSLRSAAELASAQSDAIRRAPPQAPTGGARQTSPPALVGAPREAPQSPQFPASTSRMWPRTREPEGSLAAPESGAAFDGSLKPVADLQPDGAPQADVASKPDVDPLLDPETLMAARALRERFVGALLGLAVGDAVAAATQFRRPGTFAPVGDMIGGGPFDLPRGAWSDDTAMALCLAESLLETNGFDPRDQIQRYTRWQQEGYLSSTGQCVGITASTARSLAIAQWRRVVFPGSHDPEQLDPEPLSRVAPIALYYLASIETIQQQAAEASRTTCQAPSVLEACRQLGGALHAALSGLPKDRILAQVTVPAADTAEKPTNTATAALAAAVWAFATTDNFREAILRAANVGGNSDVVASICGQLAGAHYGFSAIPPSWRNGLMQKDLIEGYADRLLAHALVCLSGAPAAS